MRKRFFAAVLTLGILLVCSSVFAESAAKPGTTPQKQAQAKQPQDKPVADKTPQTVKVTPDKATPARSCGRSTPSRAL